MIYQTSHSMKCTSTLKPSLQVQTILHELMHAIGMHHEQSRDDRDRYIKIFYDNIVGGTGNKNMNIYPTFDRYPYDAESVLQYGLYVSQPKLSKLSTNKCIYLRYYCQRTKDSYIFCLLLSGPCYEW